MPKECPVCGGRWCAKKAKRPAAASTSNCPARLKESIRHFASRGVMNIDGLGDALIDQLVDRGLVKSVADLYDLTVDQLANLERMGPKSAANVIRNIDRSRYLPMPRVITALGIRFVGERTAEFLAEHFGIDGKDRDGEPGGTAGGDGSGPEGRGKHLRIFPRTAEPGAAGAAEGGESVVRIHGAEAEGRAAWRDDLRDYGNAAESDARGSEIQDRSRGRKVAAAVSRKTSFVVAGEDAGSKLDKARDAEECG